ncbi:uncharacterized protein LOC129728552 [Wyeomyia smithii]|uniref:uncharacterized protein LOC129728552 n=1 Tax=Wyeomyia smithii TaxID=174621 RepID=UPI00246817F2|nr:uncharacterized protein LOC129728552 [Wyeomyia smithii]
MAATSTLETTIERLESKLDQVISWQKEVVDEIRGMANTLEQLRLTADTLAVEQQQLRTDNYELRKQLEWNETEIDKLKSTRRGGGSAIFAHKKIPSKLLYTFCDEYNSIVAVEIGDREKTVLACIYRPPDSPTSPTNTFLDLLEDFLTTQTFGSTIIAGDFNFDLLSTSTIVQRYFNLVLSNGFYFCDNTPTRQGACLNHVITNNIDLLINTQHFQYSLFDHDTMFIEVECAIDRTPAERITHTKTNVHLVRECLLQNLPDTNARSSVDAIRASTKIKEARDSPIKQSKPWVDKEMSDCIRTKNYWLYCANCFERQRNNVAGTWGVIREILGKSKTRSTNTLSDRFTKHEDKRRAVSDANEYFATVGKNLANNIVYTSLPPIRMQTGYQFTLQAAPESTIQHAINNMSTSKAAGYDYVQPNVLKQCSDILISNITSVVNSSINQSHVPSELKISKVVPIPKTSTPVNFCDYRPINIPSATDKILQKTVNTQLTEYLEKYDFLSSRQYGFRPRSNTQTALFDVVTEIQTHCDKKEKVAAVFLDLSKAFDTCDKRILLRRFSELGINGSSQRWFKSFLNQRQQYVSDKGFDSVLHSVEYGVVQGSILGPTLFNCYVNLKDIPLHGTLFMYADDIVLVNATTSTEQLQTLINEDLERLLRWMNQHKLTLNAAKTKYMLFNDNMGSTLNILYNGEQIELVQNFKYLGVWFDSELKWTYHIRELNKKLSQVAGVFKKISDCIPIETKRNLYFFIAI